MQLDDPGGGGHIRQFGGAQRIERRMTREEYVQALHVTWPNCVRIAPSQARVEMSG
jgi:hypothetical protein